MPRLPESLPRSGFFEHGEYLATRSHLPAAYQDFLDFGYMTGWRRGEIRNLKWRDVERNAGVIRLHPELSKNRQGRTLVLDASLKELIERRWKARNVPLGGGGERLVAFVFHVRGKQIGDFRKTWENARKVAGLTGRKLHDLRRTVVRNPTRAGVPERVAMSVTGHETRAVFDRYKRLS